MDTTSHYTLATTTNQNAHLVFDYLNSTNTKYAVLKDGGNQWTLGRRTNGSDTDLWMGINLCGWGSVVAQNGLSPGLGLPQR